MANAPQPPVRISLDIVGAVRRGARNTGRWPVRPAGILTAVVQASISGVKLRWRTDLKVYVPSMVDFGAVGLIKRRCVPFIVALVVWCLLITFSRLLNDAPCVLGVFLCASMPQ